MKRLQVRPGDSRKISVGVDVTECERTEVVKAMSDQRKEIGRLRSSDMCHGRM